MAKPIEPTPILGGKDAENFERELKITEAKHDPSKEEFLNKCKEVYKETKRRVD